MRIGVVISIIATIALTIVVLCFLDGAGGHWCQYGPSYKFLNDLRGKIHLLAQKGGFCPDLRLVVPEKGKFDENAIRFILAGDYVCKNGAKPLPLDLSITWDAQSMRYDYTLVNGE
jgi:hypothetical protein